jgi:hypothetical protein
VLQDYIIFPEEAEFLPIPQCPSSKAFVLKFKNSSARLYIWIQEPNWEEYGDEFVKKVHRTLGSRNGHKLNTGTIAAGPSKATAIPGLDKVLANGTFDSLQSAHYLSNSRET